jgi:hypothetical protein
MSTDLRTHPKVVRISSALKADRLRVVGALHAVWCLFDAHSADGSLDGYTFESIDEFVGWNGFSRAMANVEWMRIDDVGVHLPGYDAHNGASAKRRAQEAERKRASRISPQVVRETSASDADKKRTREEKRREEKTHTLSKDDLLKAGVSDKVARDWLTIRKAKRAPLTETAWDTIKAEALKANLSISDAIKVSVDRGWQGFKADWLKDKGTSSSNSEMQDLFRRSL